jgi:hypothetical protein
MPGSFTRETLHAVLCKILKGGMRPTTTDPAIAQLAQGLNRLQEEVRHWLVWRDELTKIDEDIRVLIEDLSTHLKHYDVEAKPPVDQPSKRYDGHIAFLRKLLEAAQDARLARDRHLPFTPGLLPPKVRLRDIKDELQKVFHDALPKASDEACYRFILEVLPDITGEILPSVGAVKIEIVEQR